MTSTYGNSSTELPIQMSLRAGEHIILKPHNSAATNSFSSPANLCEHFNCQNKILVHFLLYISRIMKDITFHIKFSTYSLIYYFLNFFSQSTRFHEAIKYGTVHPEGN
jgi:hypothetical protein